MLASSVALKRGSACLNCRHKKMKCDGAQPICGQCGKSNTLGPCMYDERRKKSRTEKLKATMTNLESRIRELEDNSPAPSSTSSPPAITTPQSIMLPSGSIEPAASDFGWGAVTVVEPQTEIPLSTTVIGTNDLYNYHGLEGAGVPATTTFRETRSMLVDTAMLHRHQFYFKERTGHHPAVTDALSLLGCYYARSDRYTHLEPMLLVQTRKAITSALAAPGHLIDAVQASTLLAVYLYLNNRITEGYYYAFPSARLAVDLGLHLPPQLEPQDPGSAVVKDRINVFWQVCMVDRCWSVVTGLPAAFPTIKPPKEYILTPQWGTLAVNDYYYPGINAHAAVPAPGLDNPIVPHGDGLSLQDMKSHAAVLFEQSARLASASTKDEGYYTSHVDITTAVGSLSAIVPPFRGYEPWRGQAHVDVELFTIHMLMQTSQLHLYSHGMPPSQEVIWAVSSITHCVRQLRISDYEFLDPVVSYCWLTTATVCMCALRADMQMNSNGQASAGGLMDVCREEVATLASAVETLATYSPLSAQHLGILANLRLAVRL